MDILSLILLAAGVLAGCGVGFGIKKYLDAKKLKAADEVARQTIAKAKEQANVIDMQAKRRAQQIEQNAQSQMDRENRRRENEARELERRLKDKESQFEQKIQNLDHKEKRVKEHEEKLHLTEKQLQEKLEHISSLTREEAKKTLIDSLEGEAKLDAAKNIKIIEEEAKQEAEKRSKKIIALAIARYAGEYSSERTVSVIQLPNEEMKGRLIGREGRNIRALEAVTGMDLIIDDTPEAVIISGFDPVRREIAKMTIEGLMQDGRVHPSRIEELAEKSKQMLFKTIKDDGEKAMFDLGVHGVHPELVRLIGSLKYRTSYTQSNYAHSIEVGFLAGMMAAELGQNVKAARRAGVLHDLGKALDHNIEGSHAVIGAEYAKKYGEPADIVHAIRAHHEDEKPNSILAHLVQASDALSGARPGARREVMQTYVNRLEDLETIGNSFDGVIRTFAIQAGREIRVVVDSEKVTDEQSIMLSRDIARKIEKEMTYPGQIKVTVLRETRAVEHAR
ncbi:MAG: ribonuclease Y [Oligoflexia bacterium]|nr:ribonuclease Y [Oligoflexia bacterium]